MAQNRPLSARLSGMTPPLPLLGLRLLAPDPGRGGICNAIDGGAPLAPPPSNECTTNYENEDLPIEYRIV